jgi:hypothetical protein
MVFSISSEVIFQQIAQHLDSLTFGKVMQVCKEWNTDFYLRKEEPRLKEKYIFQKLPEIKAVSVLNGNKSLYQTELNVDLLVKCILAVRCGLSKEYSQTFNPIFQGALFTKTIDDKHIKIMSFDILIYLHYYIQRHSPMNIAHTYYALRLYVLQNAGLFKKYISYVNSFVLETSQAYANAELGNVKHSRKIKTISKQVIRALRD